MVRFAAPVSELDSTTTLFHLVPAFRKTRLSALAFVLAILPPLVIDPPPALADGAATESVELELREGWNTVSLPVTPADKRLSAIFQDVLADIVLVKDDAGNTYIPEFDIDTIGEWDPLKAYMVNARSPVALSVTGVRLAPQDAGIPLKAGWNLIPYLLDEEKTVEEALASIIDLVVLLKDQDGNIFSPAFEIDNIKVFRPGRGYQINVSEETVLTYPGYVSVPGNPGNRRFEVNTISDAIALIGMVPGDRVTVLGYHEPGDGGGGEFIVDDGADEIDGGTTFGFIEHEVERSRMVNKDYLIGNRSVTLDPDIVHGSLRYYFNETEFFEDPWMHGHRLSNATGPTYPLVQYKQGRLRGYHVMLSTLVEGTYAKVTYRTNPSPLRLKRVGVNNMLNIEWFGAIRADENNPIDVHHIVAHTINRAYIQGIENVLTPGRYYYHGPIEIKDGITLRGLGVGTSAMIVIPDVVLEHRRRGYDRSNIRRALHQQYTVILTHGDALYARIKDLEINGNYANNLDWYHNPDDYSGGLTGSIEELQNTPSWNGFSSTTHGHRESREGLQVVIEDSHIHGFGGNVIMSNAGSNARWTVKNTRLGGSLRNHVIYGNQGYFENITIHGFAWGSFLDLYQDTHINGLYFEDGEDNPVDAPYSIFATFRDDAGINAESIIENFDLDFTDTGRAIAAFGGIGNNVTVRNGRAKGAPNREIRLFVENHNGHKTRLWNNYVFENIELEVVGTGGAYVLGATNRTWPGPGTQNLSFASPAVFRNIKVVKDGEPFARPGMPTFWIRAWHRNHSTWNARQSWSIEDFEDTVGSNWILKTDVHPDALGLDLFIRRSKFNNSAASDPFVNQSQNGNLSGIHGDINKLRVFFDEVEFNVSASAFSNHRIFPHVARFRNCRTPEGLTSEDGAKFEFVATGGETYVEIPTTLFWHASAHNVTGAAISSVESVRKDNTTYLRVHFSNALQASQQITLDWDAAVRPFDL